MTTGAPPATTEREPRPACSWCGFSIALDGTRTGRADDATRAESHGTCIPCARETMRAAGFTTEEIDTTFNRR